MYPVQIPYFLKKMYPTGPIWEMPASEKAIYLSFDDGPVPEVTSAVLQILASYNVKATFFCVGENIQRYPEIFSAIMSQGHVTGNHSYNHLNGWKTDSKRYYENINRCDIFHSSKLFRPPYGRIKPSQVIKLRRTHNIIMWSVLSGDFDVSTSPQKCLENVIQNTKSGSIVVFHDSYKAKEKVLYALPQFIRHFQEQGFVFKTL